MSAKGIVLLAVLTGCTATAQQPPELLFRLDWKESPPELPLSQQHVANPDLVVSIHGPGMHGVKKSHHDWIENDPYYVWSGACPGNWAVTLRDKTRSIDLTGAARVRWRSKQSGFRQLRLILKLKDGTWLVSDGYDDASPDWRIHEFLLSGIGWRRLNMSRVAEAQSVEAPDLGAVEEVGFTDLMPGGLSDACSRLDWIEVYGRWSNVSR